MTDNLQPSTKRQCKKCGETKPFEEFALLYVKNSNGQNYRQHTCQSCAKVEHAERMRKARANNPERYQGHQRKHRAENLDKCRRQKRESDLRLKTKVMESYGGCFCACCGEKSMSMLTIDHINGDGSAHRREVGKQYFYEHGKRALVADLYRWIVKNDYPSGFQVLCYNCNISKHRLGICEHQLGKGSTTSRKA